jgi:hypothetical protein
VVDVIDSIGVIGSVLEPSLILKGLSALFVKTFSWPAIVSASCSYLPKLKTRTLDAQLPWLSPLESHACRQRPYVYHMITQLARE